MESASAGGASAAYGSDALAGVVNFVLDKTYEGTKGEISGGVTTYGDDYNYRIRLTEGFGFDGDRGDDERPKAWAEAIFVDADYEHRRVRNTSSRGAQRRTQ